MKKIAILPLLFLTIGSKVLAEDRPTEQCRDKKIRALVVPFINETRQRSQSPLSMALAASLSPRTSRLRTPWPATKGQATSSSDATEDGRRIGV
jgi:hypothetical protein